MFEFSTRVICSILGWAIFGKIMSYIFRENMEFSARLSDFQNIPTQNVETYG